MEALHAMLIYSTRLLASCLGMRLSTAGGTATFLHVMQGRLLGKRSQELLVVQRNLDGTVKADDNAK